MNNLIRLVLPRGGYRAKFSLKYKKLQQRDLKKGNNFQKKVKIIYLPIDKRDYL